MTVVHDAPPHRRRGRAAISAGGCTAGTAFTDGPLPLISPTVWPPGHRCRSLRCLLARTVVPGRSGCTTSALATHVHGPFPPWQWSGTVGWWRVTGPRWGGWRVGRSSCWPRGRRSRRCGQCRMRRRRRQRRRRRPAGGGSGSTSRGRATNEGARHARGGRTSDAAHGAMCRWVARGRCHAHPLYRSRAWTGGGGGTAGACRRPPSPPMPQRPGVAGVTYVAGGGEPWGRPTARTPAGWGSFRTGRYRR